MKMSSYRKINYALRPAKNIERKMLLEAFRKLSFIDNLSNYRYIGFGSTYFTDFELFHRELNIINMISIEKDEGSRPRFEFNRPYSHVKIEFGNSNDILPRLEYKQKDIIWLDYDGQLNKSTLDDIDTVLSNIEMGSIFLLSINVELHLSLCDEDKKDPKKFIKKQKEYIDTINQQTGLKIDISKFLEPKNNIFKEWNFSKKCQNIINTQIEKTIQDRNNTSEDKIKYQQLFNFHYNDGAKMLTIGGIISDSSFDEIIPKCKFEELFFTSSTDESFLIDTPNLTYREIKYLNKYISLDINKIPKDGSNKKIDSIIPLNDIKKFHKIYRYFPTFTEANL